MKIFGIKTIYNFADYRLISKKAVEYLTEFEKRILSSFRKRRPILIEGIFKN